MKRVALGSIMMSLVPTAALAQSPSSSFQVRVTVPEYCQISATPLLVGEGDGMVTGTVLESCNTQDGFQVVAAHRPLAVNERITLNYAGEESYLQSHGWSEVVNRTGARYGIRPIKIRYTSLVDPLTISLTVTTF